MTTPDDADATAAAPGHDDQTTDIPNDIRTEAARLAYSEVQDPADDDEVLLGGGNGLGIAADWRRRLPWAGLGALVCAIVVTVVWFSMPHVGNGRAPTSAPSASTGPSAIESSASPAPHSPARRATQGVDPAHGGPAVGSGCSHSDANETTVSDSGVVVRCVSAADGYQWQPDTGDQVDAAIVGQPGWGQCLKRFPVAKCAMAAAKIAGAADLTEPVYPPGSYDVPAGMPVGRYGASVDFGTGQFSNGVAQNACAYMTYDAAGHFLKSGSYDSAMDEPRVDITSDVAKFWTSGCTPWALTTP
jgi:serine/threonine-protein kinase